MMRSGSDKGLIRKLKRDVERGGDINRLAPATGWLELYLLSCTHGSFVQAVPESLFDSDNLNPSRGSKNHAHHDLSLYLQAARFGGVDRIRLGGDFNGLKGRRRQRF